MTRPVSIFFGHDRGMVFFLAFLTLITIFAPMIALSQPWRITLSAIFVVTLISGGLAMIRERVFIFLLAVLALSNLSVDLITEFAPSHSPAALGSALKVVCLSTLVYLTLKQTLRPGRVTVYRVMGGIAGYLLIGLTWTFAYQLIVQEAPGAIHFAFESTNSSAEQPRNLIYFSFVTLATVGYGDAYPIHPAARSLAVAEALVGQLYVAILIASLVGMALHARSESARGGCTLRVPSPTESLQPSSCWMKQCFRAETAPMTFSSS